MERYVKYVIFAFFSLTHAKQYRLDYKYNSEADAFYKLHIDTVRQSLARDICSREGAHLMTISSNVDVLQAISLFEPHPEFEQAWVDAKRSADELRDLPFKCDIADKNWTVHSESCYSHLPFICKVNASDVYYDSRCQVFGTDYEYVPTMGSCYRIPRIALTWDQANDECNAQGAHLVIINSKEEDRAVLRIYKKNTHIREVSDLWWWFFAGFRANESDARRYREFRTVLNQTLDEVGYANWDRDEPNNAGGVESCGAIFHGNGKFNDVNCLIALPFICEKKID